MGLPESDVLQLSGSLVNFDSKKLLYLVLPARRQYTFWAILAQYTVSLTSAWRSYCLTPHCVDVGG